MPHQIQNAAEGPQVERAPRGWADAARQTQVIDRAFALAESQAGARGVLARDVGHDVRQDHLLGDHQRLREATRLHVREIELAEQQRARGAVQTGAEGQPALGILGASARRACERRLPEQQLGSRSRGTARARPRHP